MLQGKTWYLKALAIVSLQSRAARPALQQRDGSDFGTSRDQQTMPDLWVCWGPKSSNQLGVYESDSDCIDSRIGILRWIPLTLSVAMF